MTREFVETTIFETQWNRLGLTEDDKASLQDRIMKDSQQSQVIPVTNGIRKIRIPLRGKGLRGGGRVLYVDLVHFERTYLLSIYAKNEQKDISAEVKKALNRLVHEIRLLEEIHDQV